MTLDKSYIIRLTSPHIFLFSLCIAEASAGISLKLSSTKDTISLLTLSLILNFIFWLYYNDLVLTSSLEKLLSSRFGLSLETLMRDGKSGRSSKSEKNETTYSASSLLTASSLAPALVMATSNSHKSNACSPPLPPRDPGNGMSGVPSGGELPSPSLQSTATSTSISTPLSIFLVNSNSTNLVKRSTDVLPKFHKVADVGDRKYT